MGYLSVAAMFDAAGNDLDMTLRWHLKYNHYPAVPAEMIEPAKAAIEACKDGDSERCIRTPFEHVVHGFLVPAWEIVNALHLDCFLDSK